jgi:hypothetical protein
MLSVCDDLGPFTVNTWFDETKPPTGGIVGMTIPLVVKSLVIHLHGLVDLVKFLARNSSFIASDFPPKISISAWK